MVSQIGGGVLTPQVLKLLGMNGNDLNSSMSALSSGNRLSTASVDVASMSISDGMNAEIASLKAASQNIAQESSMMQVAGGSTHQIGAKLDRMAGLSVQANSGALDDASRKAIDQEFQHLKADIDHLAKNTNFGGVKLLDGSFSSENSSSGEVGIENLGVENLFAENQAVNLLSADNAEIALNVVKDALTKVTSANAYVGSVQSSLDYTAANIDVALQNTEAASASLSNTDIVSESTKNALLQVQREGIIAAQVQGNKLNGNILKLVSG